VHREKEAECFNRLRVLNRKKAVIRARAKAAQHIQAAIDTLSKRLEREPSKEVKSYILRMIKMLESNIAMLEMANKKAAEEIEAEEQRWYEECAEVVHYALQRYTPPSQR